MRKIQKNGLVSVIVPVYNVDKYLKRCVDSILRQTYAKLEIILVDDGSTDQSGVICDTYAHSDSRIRVLHKKNGGMSDARNAGLEMATGEYVYFIDSDDFVSDDAVEFLYNSMLSYGADIATHGYVIHYSTDSNTRMRKHTVNKQQVYTNEGALEQLLYEKRVTTSACMKLYRRHLFGSSVRFPVGKTCEDLATIYKLFSNSRTIVLNTIPMYYYYKRQGSITQSGFDERSMDGIDIAIAQLGYISERHPRLLTAAKSRLFSEVIYVAMNMPIRSKQYNSEKRTALMLIDQYKSSVACNPKARVSMRLRAMVAYLGVRNMVVIFSSMLLLWRNVKRIKFGMEPGHESS